LSEFTGERVVPASVDPDLWNEHVARYAFAARLSPAKRVLDAGCGTGFGAARLAARAARVTGVDTSREAIEYARAHYPDPRLEFLRGDVSRMPFRDESFDLVSAFEVIEHLRDWRGFLREARRVLSPQGQLVISTPNKLYYAESRLQTGPNPFHWHEFDFPEFRDALRAGFPHVSLFIQNHAAGLVFQPLEANGEGAELDIEEAGANPEEAHFLVAVCATSPLTGSPAFAYVPATGNLLREREQHIEKLSLEIQAKDQWLTELREEHRLLVEDFRRQNTLLEDSNQWARDLSRQLGEAQQRIVELQREVEEKTAWALEIQKVLEQKGRELLDCIERLDRAEATVVERSNWAMQLDAELTAVRGSRWHRLGRKLRLGPEIPEG